MPDRSTVAQVVQVRKEATYGTDPGGALTKKMSALALDLTPEADFPAPFLPMGNKWPTLDPIGKEWSSAAVSGRATYTEMIYPLSMISNTPAVSTAITVGVTATGTTSREWIFEEQTSAADTPTSYTAETGDANFADLVTGLILTDFGIAIDRGGLALSGTGMARQFTSGITLNGTVTAIALVPIIPSQVNVYMDTTSAGLGTTQLTRAFSVNFGISSRFGGVWPLDSSQASYAGFIETQPDTSFELVMEADTVGEGLLAAMRADTAKFFRVRALGAIIETTVKYGFQLDVCAHVVGAPKYGDTDGVKTITWPMKAFYDATWTRAFQIKIVNTLTAL